MSEVIVITSGKGGVGKTTTTANVGTGLAQLNKKVVLIDTDIGLRNLDVVMGLENRIVYNLVDVVEGNCKIKQALIKDKKLLLIDDSIVRGTQLRETTEFLYRSGAKEVHVRPACPPIMYGCKYLNFSRSKSEMELIARQVIEKREGPNCPQEVLDEYADPHTEKYEQMVQDICKMQNFTSLRYHRLDDLLESIGIDPDNICTYCFNGKE